MLGAGAVPVVLPVRHLVPGGDLVAAQRACDLAGLGDLEGARDGSRAGDLDRSREGRGRAEVGQFEPAGEQDARREAVPRYDESGLGERELAAVDTADRLRRLETEVGLRLS